MAKVVATQRGYFGGEIREMGDVFNVPDGAKASWFKPVGGAAADLAEPVAATVATKAKPGPKPRGETVQAPTSAPFMDAPEPVTVRVENAANAATGATQPDWVAPSDI